MKNQGKKWSQIFDSETFIFIAMIIIAFTLFVAMMISCKTTAQNNPQEEERIWIHMGQDSVELVADEYGSQYLKQESSSGRYIYIPYVGETEKGDTLHFYNVKNK